ncbi:hypothetical protein GCM10020295_81890 [Streptomyces cinereospinus]
MEDRPHLAGLWADEPKDALSLYLHIPFCEIRCGFCNLFTRVGAPDGLTGAYLDALDRQAGAVREALAGTGEVRFATAAFGGGTPTFLTAAELDRLCDIAEHRMGADLRAVPLSVEASPATATADRLAVLARRGVTRLSLGVQSFIDSEARAAVRPQRRADVDTALGRVREAAYRSSTSTSSTASTARRPSPGCAPWTQPWPGAPKSCTSTPSTSAPSPASTGSAATPTPPGTSSDWPCTGWAATISSPMATCSGPCACSAAPTPRRRVPATTPARPTA